MIVGLQAKRGQRAERKSLLERMVAQHGPSLRGFLGSTRYEVLDDPDMLIEIAEWESAEVRVATYSRSAKQRATWSLAARPILQLGGDDDAATEFSAHSAGQGAAPESSAGSPGSCAVATGWWASTGTRVPTSSSRPVA